MHFAQPLLPKVGTELRGANTTGCHHRGDNFPKMTKLHSNTIRKEEDPAEYWRRVKHSRTKCGEVVTEEAGKRTGEKE